MNSTASILFNHIKSAWVNYSSRDLTIVQQEKELAWLEAGDAFIKSLHESKDGYSLDNTIQITKELLNAKKNDEAKAILERCMTNINKPLGYINVYRSMPEPNARGIFETKELAIAVGIRHSDYIRTLPICIQPE